MEHKRRKNQGGPRPRGPRPNPAPGLMGPRPGSRGSRGHQDGPRGPLHRNRDNPIAPHSQYSQSTPGHNANSRPMPPQTISPLNAVPPSTNVCFVQNLIYFKLS